MYKRVNIRERGFEHKGFRLGQEVILKNFLRCTLNGRKVKIIGFDTQDNNMYVGVDVDREIGVQPCSGYTYTTDLLRGSCRKFIYWCYIENIEII